MTARCIIVDDEDLILQRLERFFAKHLDEFELAGKAYSGFEGTRLALELKPDIVVTDIVMPEMGGMEMVERLRGLLPSAEFVILTAYADFEYAKQAIRYGVKDYIVKVPLSEEALLQALRKAKETLDRTRRQEAESRRFDQYRLTHLYRMRRQLLSELVQGHLSEAGFIEQAAGVNIEAGLGACRCLVAEWVDPPAYRAAYGRRDQSAIRYGMANVIEETIAETGRGFACEISDSRILAVFQEAAGGEREQYGFAQSLGDTIVRRIRTYMKQEVHVGISRRFSGWSGLREAFGQASGLLTFSYYETAGEVWLEERAYGMRFSPDAAAAGRPFDRLLANCRSGSTMNRVRVELDGMAPELAKLRLEPGKLAALMTDFMRSLQEHRRNLRMEAPALAELDWNEPRFRTHWQAFVRFVEAAMSGFSGKPEIMKARQYIELHIASRLSLDEIAGAANMNPSYFSSIFKKEMEESVVDYVNRRKIERAAAYLREKKYSNRELCELVGINSEKYFCTLFKQFYGVTPQKYRKGG